MKTGILLIGTGKGKTHIARIIAKCFKKSYSVDHHQVSTFLNLALSQEEAKKVKCLIIEGVPVGSIEDYFNAVTEGITLRLKYNDQRVPVHPKIILTCSDSASKVPVSASFTARFDVIKVN